jgi:hypothetical protein
MVSFEGTLRGLRGVYIRTGSANDGYKYYGPSDGDGRIDLCTGVSDPTPPPTEKFNPSADAVPSPPAVQNPDVDSIKPCDLSSATMFMVNGKMQVLRGVYLRTGPVN